MSEQPVSRESLLDLLDTAWGVIANVCGGDWHQESDEWVDAAIRWRNRWHAVLAAEPRAEPDCEDVWHVDMFPGACPTCGHRFQLGGERATDNRLTDHSGAALPTEPE
jgi:hypothetical protein